MKFHRKIAEQSEYYTRLKEGILNSYQDIHFVPLWVRDFVLEAINSAIEYRGGSRKCKIKTNHFTINIMLPIHLTWETVSFIHTVPVEYDDDIPDGEIDINGFRHQVWPRNLKFLDLMKLGD